MSSFFRFSNSKHDIWLNSELSIPSVFEVLQPGEQKHNSFVVMLVGTLDSRLNIPSYRLVDLASCILPDLIVPFQHLFAILLRRCHRSNLACCPATILRASFQSFQFSNIWRRGLFAQKSSLYPRCMINDLDTWKESLRSQSTRNCCTTPTYSFLKATISMSHKHLRSHPKTWSSFQAPSKNMRLPSSESSWKV